MKFLKNHVLRCAWFVLRICAALSTAKQSVLASVLSYCIICCAMRVLLFVSLYQRMNGNDVGIAVVCNFTLGRELKKKEEVIFKQQMPWVCIPSCYIYQTSAYRLIDSCSLQFHPSSLGFLHFGYLPQIFAYMPTIILGLSDILCQMKASPHNLHPAWSWKSQFHFMPAVFFFFNFIASWSRPHFSWYPFYCP